MAFDLDVTKRLGETEVALPLEAGEGVTVLFGPSGVGKTSVLNMVAGLLRPDRGHVRVGGVTLFDADAIDVPVRAPPRGLCVPGAAAVPAPARRREPALWRRARRRWSTRSAQLLGIAHLLDRWPRTLSGGEAQARRDRARLAQRSGVPAARRAHRLARPRPRRGGRARDPRRARRAGLPILMVTHDRAEAERLATRIVEMVR